MSSGRRGSIGRRQNRQSASRRSLFDFKRKRYLNEYHPDESPKKYQAINSESSEDDDRMHLTPELKPRRVESGLSVSTAAVEKLIFDSTPESPPTQILIYDSEDDERPSNQIEILPSTPVCNRGQDMEISEFLTPQKEHIRNESDSPPKTPLLGSFREDNMELDISEYTSPARRSPAAKSVTKETCTDILTSDETEDESHLLDGTTSVVHPKSGAKGNFRKQNKNLNCVAILSYSIQDCAYLSLIVLKSCQLDNANGKVDGILVWSLCYDATYEIERYVVLVQRPGKKIKSGICIRLFPPWQVSLIPAVDGEVIHSVHLYQLISPPLLGITTDKIREVVNKASSAVSYSKFHGSIPVYNGEQLLKCIPQLQYTANTIIRQAAAYRTSIDVDAMVWLTFLLPDYIHVLIKDCDNVFGIVEIPRDWYDGNIKGNMYTKFSNLVYGERITPYTYAPLFSVLQKLGTHQDSYHKFLWRPGSTLEHSEISPEYISAVDIKEEYISLLELKNTAMDDSRVSVVGIICVMTHSEITILDREDKTIVRISVLSAFRNKNLILPHDVGRKIDISFLRVTDQNVYTLDQYSQSKFVDNNLYSIPLSQRFSSSAPLQQ